MNAPLLPSWVNSTAGEGKCQGHCLLPYLQKPTFSFVRKKTRAMHACPWYQDQTQLSFGTSLKRIRARYAGGLFEFETILSLFLIILGSAVVPQNIFLRLTRWTRE